MILVFTSFLSLFAHPLPAHAVAKTWDGGCGANTNWSCANNWSDNIVPASGDTLTFNGTSTNNSTVDALFNATETISSLTISSGYTGTITLATTLHISGNYSQAAGSFTAAAQTLDMNGSFTLSAGTFTASSGTTTLAGAMTISGTPTFSNNSGTFTFDGTTTASLSCNSVIFNSVTFAHTTGTKTVGSNCSLPLGNNPSVSSAVSVNGTLSGSGTLSTTAGTFTIGTTGILSGFSGMTIGGGMTINGTLNAGSYSTFSVNGSFALGAASVFTAPSGILSVIGLNFTAGATFNANGGTVNYTGNSSSSSCGGVTFNLVTFNNTATKTIGSDCTLPLGNNPTLANSVTVNGTLSGTGTISTTAGTLTIGTTGTLSGFSGINTTTALTINGTLNAGSYSTFTVGSTLTLGATAVFTAPSGTLNLGGSLTITPGATFNANGGTLNLTIGTGTLSCGGATFNLVTINGATNIKTIGSDCNLPLGNNPVITRVVLNGTLSGTGTLTHTTSTFQLNAGATLSGFTGLQDNTSLIIAGATLDANNFSTFNIISALTVSSGSFTATTSGFSIGTSLSMSGGTFNAPSGTLNVSGLNITGGTFNANGGLVSINDGTGTLTCGGATFNLVTFTNYGPKTINSGCTLPLGNNPTLANTGQLIFNGGVLTGSGDLTVGGDITMLSGNPLSGFDSLTIASGHDLTIGSSNVDLSTLSSLVVGADFDQGNTYGGAFTFTAPGMMYVGGNFIAGAALTHFDSNNGTLIFNGSGDQSLSCSNTVFNSVIISNGGGTLQVSNDCNLPLGNDTSAMANILYLLGTLSGSGTLTTNGTLQIASTGYTGLHSLEGFTGLTANNLIIDGTTISFDTFNTLDVNGNFTEQNNATYTSTSNNMTVGGTFTINPGSTFNANGGTVTFDGTDYQIVSCNGAVLNSVVINKSSGDMSINSLCNLPLGNNPTISLGSGTLFLVGQLSGSGTLNDFSGTLQIESSDSLSGFTGLNANNLTIDGTDLNLGTYNTLDINSNFSVINTGTFTTTSANMTVGGNFTIETGSTFNANGGTVILDGSNQVIMGTTFNNLSKIVASADTLTFPAGGTETILGSLILKGGSATELLTLVSSSPGNPWQIDAQGSRTLQYLDVSDSNNINASVMIAYDSINSGGNTYWTFQNTPVPPTPTPSPVSPATTTVAVNTNGYLLHPAGPVEGTVTIVTNDNNKQDNAGRANNNKPNRTNIYIWWSSIIGILLFACITAYILYVSDKKRHRR